jgi:hypothetical protein
VKSAEPMCDHHHAVHMRGGEPVSVRICTLCTAIDWADLRTQVMQVRVDAFHEGAVTATRALTGLEVRGGGAGAGGAEGAGVREESG